MPVFVAKNGHWVAPEVKNETEFLPLDLNEYDREFLDFIQKAVFGAVLPPPPNEVHLHGARNQLVRIVNIGEGKETTSDYE